MWSPQLFAGKVVFVTGGAGTICRRMTEAMVTLGADACIVGRRTGATETAAREIASRRPGSSVIGLSADVRDYASLEAAVSQCLSHLGRIDYVIAGAAGNFLASIDQLSPNAFQTVMNIDVCGSFNTLKATTAAVKETKGAYVFVSATLHYTGTPYQAHVCAAKSAVDQLTKVASQELGPFGVRVNGLAPGPIANTEGMARLADPRYIANATKKVPLQRWGTVDEVAQSSVFLFSPAATFITGHVLVVDGGAWMTAGPLLPYPESVVHSQETMDALDVQGKLRKAQSQKAQPHKSRL
jgi:peroxisomal 2,4-dienoyl-CoA reductase